MFKAACDPVERWLIQGADHGEHPEEYPARLIAFFDATLK
jgi:hypothetical protein